MTLKELTIKVDWNDSWEYYNEYYKEYNVDYHIFEGVLLKLKKSEIIESELDYLILYKMKDDGDGWFDVSGYKESEKQNYGISFSPWDELTGLNVRQMDGLNLSDEKLLAHLIFEITWDGWSEQVIKEKYDILVEKLKEAEDDIANGRTYTWEEVKAELGLDFDDESED